MAGQGKSEVYETIDFSRYQVLGSLRGTSRSFSCFNMFRR